MDTTQVAHVPLGQSNAHVPDDPPASTIDASISEVHDGPLVVAIVGYAHRADENAVDHIHPDSNIVLLQL
ncbi:hypothetical protein RDI58_024191 [Solanum bulbocastanum]|uniref:Uncharacterized protein n=1 Tax=Solanum bulbocastanum TaxID=147425 RepID=A0AAN8Y330_SOLBU